MGALERYRQKASRPLIVFLVVNAAVLATLAFALGLANAISLAVSGLALAILPGVFWWHAPTAFATRLASTLAGVGFAALFLEFAPGTELILDMHMYFFAVLAIYSAWCCIPSLVAAAAFVFLHHLTLNYILPAAVFPAASSFSRVLLHAFVVLVEVAALSAMIRRLCEAFQNGDAAVAGSAEARAVAVRLAEQQSAIATREAEARSQLTVSVADFRRSVAEPLESIRDTGAGMLATSELLLGTAAVAAEAVAAADSSSSASADGAHSCASRRGNSPIRSPTSAAA